MSVAPDELFVSTTPGLEPSLVAEARSLGFEATETPGGAALRGSYRTANLELRTASRVLLRVAQFRAQSPAVLAPKLAEISLAPYRDGQARVEIEASSHRSSLGPAASLERAGFSAWRLPPQQGRAEDESPRLSVFIRAEGDQVTVSVDTTGALLSRRGYRQEVSRAPLRESLAAGMLLLAGYRREAPLWDPMCGSGTIPIEAALLARRLAPGIARRFAFEDFPSHQSGAWEEEKARAREQALVRAPSPIWATDLNAGSLGTARRNARRAGVLDQLTLERQDARAFKLPGIAPGLIASNLPYGIRVGEKAELGSLYRAFGQSLKQHFAGWRFALLVSGGERDLGLASSEDHEVENGGIACRLIVGRLPDLLPRGR